MDFQPPTTAARLRDAVIREWRIMLDEAMAADSWPTGQQFEQAAAALDTLIQYHRAAGAVEALERLPCEGCGNLVGHQSVGKRICGCSISTILCHRCSALKAAQARLAAYEEER